MNTNGTNPGMNVDDYENIAVQKSNTAKRVAASAAMIVGGATVGAGAAYAAASNDDSVPVIEDEHLTAEDVVDGANVGNSYQESNDSHTETINQRVVYVEKQPEPSEEEEPTVTWDEKTVVYDEEGNVTGSIETGTVNGKNFMLMDVDGDEHADYLAIDMDGNNRYDDNEIVKYDVSDHVHMGHETAHTKEIHYNGSGYSEEPHYIAQNDADHTIHNNFEDEKTGESYYDDYAENNPDYNPNADVNDYGSNNYLAENDTYDSDEDSYSADMNQDYLAESEGYDNGSPEEYMANEDVEEQNEPLESSTDYTAETDAGDSYEDMVGGEEFLG